MYTKDHQGYPVAGAPIPHYISTTYSRVCSTCKALWDAVGNKDYWRTAQREWENTQEAKRKKLDGLSGKTDYFTGV
jgi:hypothetical protein